MEVEFITDEKGNEKSVVLPISYFENLQDLATILARKDEPTTSHNELLVLVD